MSRSFRVFPVLVPPSHTRLYHGCQDPILVKSCPRAVWFAANLDRVRGNPRLGLASLHLVW